MSVVNIVMIDDDIFFLNRYSDFLSKQFKVHCAESIRDGIKLIEKIKPDVILLDISFNGEKEGLEILPHLKSTYPQSKIIIVTNWDAHIIFREAILLGANDFFVKSENLQILFETINNLMFKQEVSIKSDQYIIKSPAMLHLFEQADKVATTNLPVVICGESGVGKEVMAKYIKCRSNRADKPWITLNCGSIPETLTESMLLGHERGSFTGAHQLQKGVLEEADGGTLFLDEIEDLSMKAQTILLRIIEEKEFNRIGTSKLIKADIRLITALKTPLKQLVEKGLFREDLYYRLAVFEFFVPPLRERLEDIEPITKHFLHKLNNQNNGKPKSLTQTALRFLKGYSWPGNVRELRNAIERAYVLAESEWIGVHQFYFSEVPDKETLPYLIAADKNMREFRKKYLCDALLKNKGNITRTAKDIGLSRQRLQALIKEIGLNCNS